MEEDVKITSGYSKVLGGLSDKEIIAKLSFELGKYQEKSKEDEAVIEKMARFIDEKINECPYDFWIEAEKELNCADCEEDYTECWKQYFRNKVRDNKE